MMMMLARYQLLYDELLMNESPERELFWRVVKLRRFIIEVLNFKRVYKKWWWGTNFQWQ